MSQAEWDRSTIGGAAPGASRRRILGTAAAGLAAGVAIGAALALALASGKLADMTGAQRVIDGAKTVHARAGGGQAVLSLAA